MLVHVQLDGSERVMALTELEDAVRAGAVGPETPVRAAVLTGDAWRPIGELALYQALQSSPEALVRRRLAEARIPWFTVIVAGIQLRIFLWMHGTPPGMALAERFAKDTPAIVERGEVERLLTYGFLHGSFDHVAMNLAFLVYVGVALERTIGAWNLAAMFFATLFWSGAISAIASTDVPSIGVSGVAYGFMAAAAVLGLRWFELLPRRERPSFGFAILIYMLWAFVSGATSEARIDNWAHLGGLVVGGLQMALLRPDVGPWRARNRRVSAAFVAVTLAGLVAARWAPIPLVPVEADGLRASRPAWWEAGWAPTGESGWASPAGSAMLVARTTKGDRPTTAAAAAATLVEAYRDIDPAAVVEAEEPARAADGTEGARVRLAYTQRDEARRVDAVLFARGRYVHRVLVDAPESEARAGAVADRVLDAVELPEPAEVAEARAAGDTWRGKLERAKAAADVGDVAEARRLVEAARAEAPGEPATAEAALAVAADYPDGGVGPLVETLLAAFPDDRDVRAGAVRALIAAGDREEALRRLDEGLAAAPKDRQLGRLKDELFP